VPATRGLKTALAVGGLGLAVGIPVVANLEQITRQQQKPGTSPASASTPTPVPSRPAPAGTRQAYVSADAAEWDATGGTVPVHLAPPGADQGVRSAPSVAVQVFETDDAGGSPTLHRAQLSKQAQDAAVAHGWNLGWVSQTEWDTLAASGVLDGLSAADTQAVHDLVVSDAKTVADYLAEGKTLTMLPPAWMQFIQPLGGKPPIIYSPVAEADTSTSGTGIDPWNSAAGGMSPGSTWVDYGGGGGSRSGSNYRNDGSSYGGGRGGYGYDGGYGGAGDWYGVPAPKVAPMGYGIDWSSGVGDWMPRPAPWDSPIFDRYFATATSGWPFRRTSHGRFLRGRRGRVTMRPRTRSGPRGHAALPAGVTPPPGEPMSSGEVALATALALRGRS
jgi:hypothetical protein